MLHAILDENNLFADRNMTKPKTTWASVAWHDNATPYATHYRDGYFGERDPAAEALHVFCKGLALPEAWESFFEKQSIFRIVELGFGTGLNFLQTARLWEAWRKKRKTEKLTQKNNKQKAEEKEADKEQVLLDYWGIERHPLRIEDLQHFYRHHKIERAESLLHAWKDLSRSCDKSCHPKVLRWQLSPSLSLTLLLQDVDSALAALPHEVDGWYCDGFAPRSNPAMWSDKVFSAFARCTRERTDFPQLASFSVAKSVRTRANAYGFRTQKRKGLLTKREVLQGFFKKGRKLAHQLVR